MEKRYSMPHSSRESKESYTGIKADIKAKSATNDFRITVSIQQENSFSFFKENSNVS